MAWQPRGQKVVCVLTCPRPCFPNSLKKLVITRLVRVTHEHRRRCIRSKHIRRGSFEFACVYGAPEHVGKGRPVRLVIPISCMISGGTRRMMLGHKESTSRFPVRIESSHDCPDTPLTISQVREHCSCPLISDACRQRSPSTRTRRLFVERWRRANNA